MDIEESKNLIRAHAKGCYPNECCGLIFKKGQKQEVLCGRNIAEKPRHNFMLHPEDYAKAEDQGEVLALYHSHCNEPIRPSDADKTVSEKHDLPVVTISITKESNDEFHEAWGIYKPCGWKADLIGRPFVDGVMDCLTLIQDHFETKHGIVLPDVLHMPGWWKKKGDKQPENLYLDNLVKHDFVQITKEKIQEDDLILMSLDSTVPNHAAIYTGDGLMLHHPANHLSGVHPYVCDRGYYALMTHSFWRHKKLFKTSLAEAASKSDKDSKPITETKQKETKQ